MYEPNNDYRDYLEHRDHKYLDKYKKNGRWIYVYSDRVGTSIEKRAQVLRDRAKGINDARKRALADRRAGQRRATTSGSRTNSFDLRETLRKKHEDSVARRKKVRARRQAQDLRNLGRQWLKGVERKQMLGRQRRATTKGLATQNRDIYEERQAKIKRDKEESAKRRKKVRARRQAQDLRNLGRNWKRDVAAKQRSNRQQRATTSGSRTNSYESREIQRKQHEDSVRRKKQVQARRRVQEARRRRNAMNRRKE